MFGKINYIILAVLMMITSVGITFSKHYCGSTLKSISVIVSPEPCCEIPSGCCHDETITVKMENDFSVVSYFIDINDFEIELPSHINLIQDKYSGYETVISFIHKPPPLSTQTILAQLQSYIL